MVTWWVAAGRRVLSSGPEVIDDLYSLSGVPCKPSILRQFHPARKMERNRFARGLYRRLEVIVMNFGTLNNFM